MPQRFALPETIPREWTPHTAEIIEKIFRKIFRNLPALEDVPAAETGLDVLGGGNQGDILYHDGTSWTRLPAGTSGQFLKTQGVAANSPKWDLPNATLFDYIAYPWFLWKSSNGNTCLGIGISNPTVSGPNGFEFHGDTLYNQVITSTVLNNTVGHNGVAQVLCTNFPWTVEFVVYTDPTAVTGVRYWFGVMTGAPAADAITTRHMAIRFSTSVPDAGWVASTADGTTQTITAIAVNSSIVAATRYVLKIRFDPTGTPTAYFSVNGGAETAVTATLAATGNMFGSVQGAVTNLVGGAGTARAYALARMQCITGSSAR